MSMPIPYGRAISARLQKAWNEAATRDALNADLESRLLRLLGMEVTR